MREGRRRRGRDGRRKRESYRRGKGTQGRRMEESESKKGISQTKERNRKHHPEEIGD